MKDYDAYLFDWDGTLADSHALWLGIVHNQLRRHGIDISDQDVVKKIFGRYLIGMREFGFSEEEVQRLSDESLEEAVKRTPFLELFPQSRDVLLALHKKGKKLGIVTASYRNVVDAPLRNNKIVDLFDVIVTGDQTRAHKPDPESILAALSAVEAKPSRAIVIGDSPKDLLAAKNAGTDSLLFFPPEHELQHDRKELEACNPTYTVRSWQELIDQLQ